MYYIIKSKNGAQWYETYDSNTANGYKKAIEETSGYVEVYYGKELIYKTH